MEKIEGKLNLRRFLCCLQPSDRVTSFAFFALTHFAAGGEAVKAKQFNSSLIKFNADKS
jgi:hypothetical protein